MTRRLALLALAILLSIGCDARLRDERTMSLSASDVRIFDIDSAESERTVNIEAKSSGGPISVYVYLADDQQEAERMITLGKESELVIARETTATDIKLSAVIPAGKAAMVQVATAGPKPAEVELLMTDSR